MKTYWENVAETRWGKYTTEIEKAIILEGVEVAGPSKKALEVGCEGGRWSKVLRDKGWKMTCTDVSQESLNICKQKIPDASCIKVEPTDKKLPAGSEEFDLLLCIEVAPVIQEDWFIEEAYRVMAKNKANLKLKDLRSLRRGDFAGFHSQEKAIHN